MISIEGLECPGTSPSVSGDTLVLNIKTEALVSHPSHLCVHIGEYNVFELLLDSDYDMNLSLLALRFSGG